MLTFTMSGYSAETSVNPCTQSCPLVVSPDAAWHQIRAATFTAVCNKSSHMTSMGGVICASLLETAMKL